MSSANSTKKGLFDNGLWGFMQCGTVPGDSDADRLKKAILSLIASIIALLAIFWGCLYMVSGYPVPGAIPLSYAAISFLSITHFFITKKFAFFRSSQFLLILVLPFALMWSLGGFANSSAVIIWAFFAPLAAMFLADLRSALRWLGAFLVLLVVSAFLDAQVATLVEPMPRKLNTIYFLMNMGCGFLLIYIVLHYFVKDREASHQSAIGAREEAVKANLELEQAYVDLRRNEQKIIELMLTDPLTLVANRRALNDRLAMEVERSRRNDTLLGVIMADLDRFKSINDEYGHAVGDEVLKAFARAAGEEIRTSDFIARFGGEEFVIVAPETTREGLCTLAERIRNRISTTKIPGLDKAVTASFGLSILTSHDNQHSLLSRADRALYISKHEGRDRVSLVA